MIRSDAPATVPAASMDLLAWIEDERRRADVAGIAFAVFDRAGLHFADALGYADLRRAERVTPRTRFRGASVSKLFTTMLVLREVDAGWISLDDPVNRYVDAPSRVLDAAGAPDDRVTIRHLLTHTSGLPVSWKGLVYGGAALKLLVNGRTPPRSLADVVNGMRTVRAPGERIVYANGGFALLGHMAARLRDTRFEDLVRTAVLAPLAMDDTSFPIDPRGPGIATPYGHAMRGGAGRTPGGPLENYTGPAGALLTSALDLSRFGRMVLRGGELDGARVVSDSLLDRATRMTFTNHPDLDAGWGLGFEVRAHRGHRTAGHSGGLTGVATRIELLPDDGAGVVVLTNGGDAAFVERVTARLLDGVLGLAPQLVPGSPRGMIPGSEPEWRAITARSVGRYRVVDSFPPGPIGVVSGLMARPTVSHVAEGVLAVDGIPGGVTFLHPDGEPGRYRIAGPMYAGARAVLESRPDGVHFWASILHMQRR